MGEPEDDWIECPMCDGVGRVPKHEAAHVFRRGGYLREDEDGTVICPNCAGDGAV